MHRHKGYAAASLGPTKTRNYRLKFPNAPVEAAASREMVSELA
jgi:hypothetical protein